MLQIKLSNWIKFIWFVATLVGFVDATYLTVNYLNGHDLTCTIINGCNQVLASSYSSIGPIPLSLLGVLYYLVMFLGLVFILDRKKYKLLKILSYFSIIGFLVSIWLLYVQWQIVAAFCQYCLLSALSSIILFILGLIILKRIKNQIPPPITS